MSRADNTGQIGQIGQIVVVGAGVAGSNAVEEPAPG